jgi:hypothetical protein
MERLMRFARALPRDAAVDRWLESRQAPLGALARTWFARLRDCGSDVRELLHDGHATVCVTDAAFAYVNVFTAHLNVGFFRGIALPDPRGLLEGTGKFMRHVKVRPDVAVDAAALEALIKAAYLDMRRRVTAAAAQAG